MVPVLDAARPDARGRGASCAVGTGLTPHRPSCLELAVVCCIRLSPGSLRFPSPSKPVEKPLSERLVHGKRPGVRDQNRRRGSYVVTGDPKPAAPKPSVFVCVRHADSSLVQDERWPHSFPASALCSVCRRPCVCACVRAARAPFFLSVDRQPASSSLGRRPWFWGASAPASQWSCPSFPPLGGASCYSVLTSDLHWGTRGRGQLQAQILAQSRCLVSNH